MTEKCLRCGRLGELKKKECAPYRNPSHPMHTPNHVLKKHQRPRGTFGF